MFDFNKTRKQENNFRLVYVCNSFNFVEDFFIVNVANSIDEEKKTNIKLKNVSDFGMISGIGWSIYWGSIILYQTM